MIKSRHRTQLIQTQTYNTNYLVPEDIAIELDSFLIFPCQEPLKEERKSKTLGQKER